MAMNEDKAIKETAIIAALLAGSVVVTSWVVKHFERQDQKNRERV